MNKILTGRTSAEIINLRKKYGFNQIEEKTFLSAFANIAKILSDPMGLMLLLLSVVYFSLGKKTDAYILFGAYIPVALIDVLLELRSNKALRALKSSISLTCVVIRNSKTETINSRELLPGDLLVLEEGKTIPADGKIIQGHNITIDESSLTGESIPIEKQLNDDVFSGTTVLGGDGVVEIIKIGLESQIGSIAKVLKSFSDSTGPLLKIIKRTVKIVFALAILLALIVFVVGYFKGQTLADNIIASLTLAMAAIPEEFPLVFTLYLSIAAYRLSKLGILVKSLPAVEGLGQVDVICTDKTGTLTEGKFKLEEIINLRESQQLTDDEIVALLLSCETKAVDAMEMAIWDWLKDTKSESFILNTHNHWKLQYDYPFHTQKKYMSHVWRGDGEQIIAMKGAAEGVLEHLASSENHQTILNIVKQKAFEGKRILGLAMKKGIFTGDRLSDEKDLNFVALLCFSDPIRAEVKDAISECKARGIEIKMLTGDHLLTAHAIADSINMPHEHDQLISGPDLDLLHREQRDLHYQLGTVFARLRPDQKLELVETVKKQGKIVAMTGDGVNDAPALKLADIGISMGDRATDVARSTAQLVLLKNDFSGIVHAIKEGQRVLKNLSESFGYLIAFHIPIVVLALFQSLFLDKIILRPIHIILLEMIVHPISAFVFDSNVKQGSLQKKKFFNKKQMVKSTIRGILLTTFSLFVYFYFGKDNKEYSMTPVTLVLGNIGLLFGEIGGLKFLFQNRRAIYATILLVSLSLALVYINSLNELFFIGPITVLNYLIIIIFSFLLGCRIGPNNDEQSG